MTSRKAQLSSIAALVLMVTGCGGGYMSSTPVMPVSGAQTSALSLTVTDTPPAGVTVLSFEVTVNGAMLNPGNVALLVSPQKIEMKELEAESAFLSTVNVPAGPYQSITVNLTNPELRILNQSGATIGSCANNSVCEIQPAAAGNITFSGAPFPVMLQGGTPSGFQIDVNVASIISNTLALDFNATGAVSVAQLPLPGQPADHLDDLDDLDGVIQNIDAANKKFTLHTTVGDFRVQAGTNTEFEAESCPANDFTCLQNGQVVSVDAQVMAGGAIIATKIEFEDDAVDDELQGVIFEIDDATHLKMVVLGELRDVENISVGNPVNVTLSNASFQVQDDGINVPSGLQSAFEGATDTSQLEPGQEIQIRAKSAVVPGPPITVTTDRVRLRLSQLTATVGGAPVPPNFTVGSLPSLFTAAGVTSIHVQTSSKTNFQGVSGASELANQDQVSLRGLLFRNGGNPPELIADKVRKR